MAKKAKTAKSPKAKKAPAAKKPAAKKSAKGAAGAPFNEQDPKRRLGNFGGAGEHPRQGGRTSGIVGQTKQKGKTDKKK
jgi:hypothetical protein